MDRLLRNAKGTIRLELRDENGDLQDPDGNAALVRVYDSAGAEMAGSPFTATRASQGIYDAALPAANAIMATLDTYDAVWSVTIATQATSFRTSFEVIGKFIFSLAELRAFDPDLASTTKFPFEKLSAAREVAEETIEKLCGVAFRPRGRRATLDGSGSATLLLPDLYPTKLVSASIDAGSGAVVMSAADLADVVVYSWGALARKTRGIWTEGARNVTVFYEYGLADPPEPVRRAAMMLARAALIPGAAPDRATGVSSEAGDFRLTTANREGPTGIPEVDAVIEQYSHPQTVIG